MKRALLVSSLSTHFVELHRIALVLRVTGNWDAAFFFTRTYHGVQDEIALVRKEGFDFRVDPGMKDLAPDSVPPPPVVALRDRNMRPSLRKKVTAVLRLIPAPVRRVLHGPWYWWRLRRTWRRLAAQVESLLTDTRADLLVLSEDNIDYGTPVYVKAAQMRGVPAVIVPYTVANAIEPAEYFITVPANHVRWHNRWFAKRHPQWVYVHRNTPLLRLPLTEAFVAEQTGLAPPLPWILNSGHADAIAAESPAMVGYYEKAGLPREQLVLTGALYDDIITAALQAAPATRAALLAELAMDPARMLILCAMPPDQMDVREAGICDFTEYAALVRFWIETLVAVPGANVIVSIHPRTPMETVAFLETIEGRGGSRARIVKRDVAGLIPLCDLYVSCVSATIRMAVACGKPVVNYDTYRYRYDDYAALPGVLTMEEKTEFSAAVNRLVTDPAFFADISAKQESWRARWGTLDGKSGERMLALFESLVARYRASTRA